MHVLGQHSGSSPSPGGVLALLGVMSTMRELVLSGCKQLIVQAYSSTA